jgi:hypothetical protein
MTVTVYPGPIDAVNTNASGSGLTHGEAKTQTSFTIQARDTEANYRYHDGSDTFNIAITGISDWAGVGRTDEVTSGDPISVPVALSPLNWTQICIACGGAKKNSSELSTTADLRCPNGPSSSCIERGDMLIVGGETFLVHASNPFTATTVPLDRVFTNMDTATNMSVFKAGTTTGTHLATYTPLVRGTYRLDITVPPTAEVQYVSTESTSMMGGSFALSYNGEQTTDIAFDASTSTVSAALNDLMALNTHGVTVSQPSGPGAHGERTWYITFAHTAYNQNDVLPLLTNGYLLTGNSAKVKAGVLIDGVKETHIVGSPFEILVAPEDTDPKRTIAYGEGLVQGEAGIESSFTIQAKDTHGNNRWENQTRDVFSVRVYQPSVSPLVASQSPHFAEQKWDAASGMRYYVNSKTGEVQWEKPMVPTIFGNVTYLVDGKYQVTYTSEIKGYYTVAVTVQQIAEVQTVQTSFSGTAGRGGTFTLQQTYNGVVSSTDKLAWDASAEAVRDAVMELPSCRPNGQQLEVSVKRTHQHEASPFIYAVTFVGYVGDMPPLVADYDQTLIGAGALVQVVETAKGVSAHIDTERRPIRNEVQRVRLTGDSSGSPDGTFALSFRGHTTAKMPVTATTDDIKAELEKLEVVGSVAVDKTATTGSITDLDITFVPQGPSVDVSTLSITSMVTNSVSEVTVAHANSISVQVAAGDTIEITGFVANTWANGIWTVVGAPTTTEFKFSAVEGGRLSPGASAVYTEIGFAASHMQGHMLVTAVELFVNLPILTVYESTLIAT